MAAESGAVFIVDPDPQERLRLKDALRSTERFRVVKYVYSPEKLEEQIKMAEACDIVFISSAYPRELVAALIADSKRNNVGAAAAFVLVLSGDKQDSATVGLAMLDGVDGFLCRPYSVQSLIKIADRAEKLKKERLEDRQVRAIKLLLDSIVEQLDSIAFLKASGYEANISMRNLRHMCAELKLLEPELLELFLRVVVEELADAPFPREIYSRKVHKGPSGRLEARLEAELVAKIRGKFREHAA